MKWIQTLALVALTALAFTPAYAQDAESEPIAEATEAAVEATEAATDATAEAAESAAEVTSEGDDLADEEGFEWPDEGTELSDDGDAAWPDATGDAGDEDVEDLGPTARTFRIGFWNIDLMALDLAPRGWTFRFADIRILKLLELGFGEDYHSVSLLEMPDLLNLITTRHDGRTYEHRMTDLQFFTLAAVRGVRESEKKWEWHALKLPVLGAAFAREVDGTSEKNTVLYVLRDEVEN